jgi:hypothetical protein
MLVLAFFSEDGAPSTGLSPVVKIRDASNGSIVVNNSAMTEIGDGFYKYNFAAFDTSKDYTIICDSVTLTGHERYTYATSEDRGLVTDIDTNLDAVGVTTTLIKKVQINKLELADGSSGNWILYDTDDSTPLLTFDVTDKDGNAISQPAGAPAKRTRGT